jgi:hypothetical protein
MTEHALHIHGRGRRDMAARALRSGHARMNHLAPVRLGVTFRTAAQMSSRAWQRTFPSLIRNYGIEDPIPCAGSCHLLRTLRIVTAAALLHLN